jgi:hypothetical protein
MRRRLHLRSAPALRIDSIAWFTSAFAPIK